MSVLDHILNHPHYPTGNVLAKQATNAASILWSVLVLANENALHRTAYVEVTKYVHENVIASALLILSVIQFAWLSFRWPPIPFGFLGYGLQFGWWLGICALICQQSPVQPTALTGTALIATLAAFAFTSGRRGEGDGGAA